MYAALALVLALVSPASGPGTQEPKVLESTVPMDVHAVLANGGAASWTLPLASGDSFELPAVRSWRVRLRLDRIGMPPPYPGGLPPPPYRGPAPRGDANELRALARELSRAGLTDLDLAYSRLDDAGLAALCELESLEHLKLDWQPNLTDRGFAALPRLARLRTLSASGCSEVGAGGLGALTRLPALESLSLSFRNGGFPRGGPDALLALDPVAARLNLTLAFDTAPEPAELARLAGGLEELRSGNVFLERLASPAAAIDVLAMLPWVTSLHLDECTLEDDDLAPLARLRRLRSVSLREWRPSLRMKPLRALPELAELSLSVAGDQVAFEFGSPHPAVDLFEHAEDFEDWDVAVDLTVARVSVLDANLGFLEGLANVRSLNLSYQGEVAGGFLARLPRVDALRSLDLYGCSGFEGDSLQALAAATGLEVLDLGGCRLVEARHLAALEKLHGLRRLGLDAVPVDDAVIGLLAALPSLQELRIDTADSVTPEGWRVLGRAQALRKLWVRVGPRGAFAGGAVNAIAALEKLELLDLAHTSGLGESDLAALARLPRLRVLGLTGCELPAAALEAFRTQRPDCLVVTEGYPFATWFRWPR